MLELGIEEMMDSEAVTIIEWADRFPALLPRNTLRLHFEVANDQAARKIKFEASGQRAQAILREWIAIGS